jgi:hypothetical protein
VSLRLFKALVVEGENFADVDGIVALYSLLANAGVLMIRLV